MSHCRIDLDSMKAFYTKTILDAQDGDAREGIAHERR
jgi:hypothetical protein